MYTPSVNYWILSGLIKQPVKGESCFSRLNSLAIVNVSKVYYECLVDESLNKSEVGFYINFIGEILDKSIFKFRNIIKDKKVLFILEASGLSRSKRLLYLSAFRYLCEFPEIVAKLYSDCSKVEEIESKFSTFQSLHQTVKAKKYNNYRGHGLLTGEKVGCLTLEKFKKNLKDHSDKIYSVQSYFYFKPAT